MSQMNWEQVRDDNRGSVHESERLSQPKPADQPASNQAFLNVRCPFCNARVMLRQSRFGPFLGCGRFPECKATCNLGANGALMGKWRRGKPPESSITTRKRGRPRGYGLG